MVHRPFNDADLPALLRFASESTRSRWPHKSPWHIGDCIWMLSEFDTTTSTGLHLWFEGARVAAVVWFESPGHVRIDAPDQGLLFDEILQFYDPDCVAAFDGDTTRIDGLLHRGYQRGPPNGVHLRRALTDAPIPLPELPAGMTFRDGRDIDVAERVAVHVDAWSHLAHIGLPDATSRFSAQRYRRLTQSTVFVPELDLVIATSAGQYVSCATCWVDVDSGVGLTEPVGTRHTFRQRGLSRAINLECLRRLREHGMYSAIIQTAHFNEAARATYLSCGYELVDRDWWYVRRAT